MNQENLPMVTVIIPYNKDRGFLHEAIKSIHDQDYKGVIQPIIYKSPNTVGFNINRAVEEAQGKYVKYFAEDDTLLPNCISDSVNFLTSNNYRWMHANSYITYYGGRRDGAKSQHVPPHNPTKEELLKFNHIHGGTVMYETALFKEFGGFDETLKTGEEYDFYLKLYSKGITPGYLDKFVFNYRKHAGQKSLGEGVDQVWRLEVINQIRNRYK